MYEAISISIRAPDQQVWELLSDVTRWAEWTASISSIERLDDGPLSVGSRVRVQQPKLSTMVYTVTELEPRRYFSWTAASRAITAAADHRVEPGPGGSVTVTLSVRLSGALSPIVGLLYGGLTRRYITMEAEGLKRRCESNSLAPTA